MTNGDILEINGQPRCTSNISKNKNKNKQQHINHLLLQLWETTSTNCHCKRVPNQKVIVNHFRLQMSSESIISLLNLKSS